MRYTEIRGDSINLRAIQQYDKKNGTNYTQTIVDNLSEVTGLQLSVDSDTGMLSYAQDEDGNAKVTQVAYEDENGVVRDDVTVDGGSKTARNDLISAIDNKKTGFARINNKSSAPRGGLLINISPAQIDKFINGANNVNKNTLGGNTGNVVLLYGTCLLDVSNTVLKGCKSIGKCLQSVPKTVMRSAYASDGKIHT